jgi:predicted RecB family endonuclease
MSVLNGLKLVAAKQERQTNPVQIRRAKLMAALDEQIALAKARQAGESYTATRAKRVKDDAGNVSVVSVPKRLKAWFWAVEGGRVCVAVRYGNKVMELGKGKTAVETAAGELVGTTSPRI